MKKAAILSSLYLTILLINSNIMNAKNKNEDNTVLNADQQSMASIAALSAVGFKNTPFSKI